MAETLDEFVPIQLGHREGGEDEVWRLGLNLIERPGPIGRRQHAGAEVFEKKPRGIQYELVIVNDEDRKPMHQWAERVKSAPGASMLCKPPAGHRDGFRFWPTHGAAGGCHRGLKCDGVSEWIHRRGL
jgi:hypothetical protein